MAEEHNNETTGSHADDIFGAGAYEAPLPPKKDFLAWHRPRKQFVRETQWANQISKLLQDIGAARTKLSYLGLPGDDLLDLRHLHDCVCEKHKVELSFLGFNNGSHASGKSDTELNISLDEVRRLEFIDDRSEVIPDDFCSLADKNSISWKRAREHGSFDIVNLDLCNGFASHEAGAISNTYYNALSRLLALQSRRHDPWLLFLTTRSRVEDVDVEVMEKLKDKFVKNFGDCPEFAELANDKLKIADAMSVSDSMKEAEGFLSVFLVGLCKWIFGLAAKHAPPWTVSVKSVIGYKVEPSSKHDDLFSIALRFNPEFTPVEDAVGLAGGVQEALLECKMAAKAVRRLCKEKRVPADQVLSNDKFLYDEMVKATATLLARARYDEESYYKWVSSA